MRAKWRKKRVRRLKRKRRKTRARSYVSPLDLYTHACLLTDSCHIASEPFDLPKQPSHIFRRPDPKPRVIETERRRIRATCWNDMLSLDLPKASFYAPERCWHSRDRLLIATELQDGTLLWRLSRQLLEASKGNLIRASLCSLPVMININ